MPYTSNVQSRGSIDEEPRPRVEVLRRLGEQLRRLRLERNFTQQFLAEEAELNAKHVGRIERAKVNPGADALVRIADVLGVPVGVLFEKVRPDREIPYSFSPADVEEISPALGTLNTIVERILARKPRPLPRRARRRRRPQR